MVEGVISFEVKQSKQLDELIDNFNRFNKKVTMCRYALKQDIILVIANIDGIVEVLPLSIKYQKNIELHLRTVPTIKQLDKEKEKKLLKEILNAFEAFELNNITFGIPEKSYDMNEELDEIVDCRWNLYNKKKRLSK